MGWSAGQEERLKFEAGEGGNSKERGTLFSLADDSLWRCHMKEKWFRSRCFLFLGASRGFHPRLGAVGGTEADGEEDG